MSQRKMGTILSYLQILITNSISLFYTPYMLRLMGQSEYGIYGTASSFISYLSLLSFGIGGSYIKFNSQYRARNDVEGERRLNGMFFTIFSILSIVVLIVGIVLIVCVGLLVEDTFTPNELYKLRIIMFILTINVIATFISNVVMMSILAYERFIFMKVILLLCGIITPVLNIIALKHGGRSIAISAISVTIPIISYIIYYFYARKVINFHFIFRGFDKSLFKEIFVFSGFLFLNSITDQITFSTDNVILSALKGTTVVAVYSVGSNFKTYFQNFSTSISSVFSSQINSIVAKSDDNNALSKIFIKVGRIQFYVISLVIIGYISIGEKFVMMWAGADYKESFWIGLLLMISIFIPSFQNISIQVQQAKNMHKARSVIYFLIALCNVSLTIPLSISFGGIGAALATAITMVIGYAIFMNYYNYKYVGLDIPGFWKSIVTILPGYVPPIIVGILINRFYNLKSYLDILISALIIIVVFIGSIWLFSMNNYEKDLIRKPVLKLKNKLNRK